MPFHFEATGIGSVPFTEPAEACAEILTTFPEIPFWPQLPKRSFLESMYAQYIESFPGVLLDEKNRTIRVDPEAALAGLEGFYEKVLANDVEYFRISAAHAAGLESFAGSVNGGRRFVKGHVTGPVSFGLTVTDTSKRSLLYHNDLFEAVVKLLVMKARWQIRLLKVHAEKVILFIDEPYLVSIGSSYVTMDKVLVAAAIDEVAAAIRDEGALAGIHCCGNTDWPFLLKRGIDIINFDAYNFLNEFLIYIDDIMVFLRHGGAIAWGIVPSSDAIARESSTALAGRVAGALTKFRERGFDKTAEASIITPSCGVGSLEIDVARRVFAATAEVSCCLRETAG